MGEFGSVFRWLYPDGYRTLLLVGKTGSGKSATGNSILADKVFDTMPNPVCVASSSRAMPTGQILTVIDTSGSFDISVLPETIGYETGIHAVLVVLSLGSRFSEDDSLAIESLSRFFGAKLRDYMIVVFTHADALEGMPLDVYLRHNCPDELAKTLCGNRFILFDNVTEDRFKKNRQRKELLRLVEEVVANNVGVPYTIELFVDPKEGQWKMSDQHTEVDCIAENGSKFNKAFYEDQLLEMELKHREMTLRFEKQLGDEKVARMQAEAALTKSNEEISKVRADLKRSQREARKLRKAQKATKELLKKKVQEKRDKEKKNNCAVSLMALSIEHRIESKLRETTLRLENQLVDKLARMQAEDKAQEAERKSNDEIRKLKEDIKRAQRYIEDILAKFRLNKGEGNEKKNNCAIAEITSTIEHKIDPKLRERILELEKMLSDEQFARTQAEAKAREFQKKSNDAEMLRRNRLMADKIGTSASGVDELSSILKLAENSSVNTSANTIETPCALSSEGFNGNVNNVVPISSGFGSGVPHIPPTPKPNPFYFLNSNATFNNSPYTMPSYFGFQTPQPLQPSSVNFSGGFSSGSPIQAGFGQPAQIGGGIVGGFSTAPSGGGFASFGTGGGGFAAAAAGGAVSGGGFGGFSNQAAGSSAFGGGGGSETGRHSYKHLMQQKWK